MRNKRIVLLLAGMLSAAALIFAGCGASDNGENNEEQSEETVNEGDASEGDAQQSDPTDYDAYIQDALAKAKGEAPAAQGQGADGETAGEAADAQEAEEKEPEKVIYVDKPTDIPAPAEQAPVVVSAADPTTGVTQPVEAPADTTINPALPEPTALIPTPTPIAQTTTATRAADETPTPKPPATPEDFPVGVCLVYVKGDPDSGYASGIIDRINTIRTEMGYPELVENDGLNKCAEMRSREVATFVSHTRPDGSLYNSLAPKYYMAELLAACRTTEEETVDAWVWYPTSRSLIFTTDYTTIGAACFNYNGLDYVVVSLGR